MASSPDGYVLATPGEGVGSELKGTRSRPPSAPGEGCGLATPLISRSLGFYHAEEPVFQQF